jgi:hypothetical protein
MILLGAARHPPMPGILSTKRPNRASGKAGLRLPSGNLFQREKAID